MLLVCFAIHHGAAHGCRTQLIIAVFEVHCRHEARIDWALLPKDRVAGFIGELVDLQLATTIFVVLLAVLLSSELLTAVLLSAMLASGSVEAGCASAIIKDVLHDFESPDHIRLDHKIAFSALGKSITIRAF